MPLTLVSGWPRSSCHQCCLFINGNFQNKEWISEKKKLTYDSMFMFNRNISSICIIWFLENRYIHMLPLNNYGMNMPSAMTLNTPYLIFLTFAIISVYFYQQFKPFVNRGNFCYIKLTLSTIHLDSSCLNYMVWSIAFWNLPLYYLESRFVEQETYLLCISEIVT